VHGRETTAQAIVRSCNVFFFDVATQIDHERILEVARRFGFGERSGIELPDEAGAVPSGKARDPAGPGPLADAAGHGQVKVTLLQLARAYAAIANGGKLVPLRVTERPREPARAVALGSEHLELVRGALIDVVAAKDGTAHALMTPGFPFAGKTGSGEAPPLQPGAAPQDDQWFVAYAPPSEPKILVAARVERFGPGADAKIVVKRVLDAWRAAPRRSGH
jgi:penicillin-binding protein 2